MMTAHIANIILENLSPIHKVFFGKSCKILKKEKIINHSLLEVLLQTMYLEIREKNSPKAYNVLIFGKSLKLIVTLLLRREKKREHSKLRNPID